MKIFLGSIAVLAGLGVGLSSTPLASASPGQPGEAYADFAADGGWCWFADPRAATRDGRTYAGWVTTNGSVQIGVLDHASGKVTTAVLHEKFQRDDHASPALFFLPDGRLAVFYSQHDGAEMYARVATRPGDISEWGPEKPLALFGGPRPRKDITYPNPVMLSSETNALYLFWRGDTWKPTMSKSADGGETWSPAQVVVTRKTSTAGNRPYVKIASEGKDRIHMVFTDGHPRNEPSNSLYYVCYRASAFHKADGTRIAGVDELPFEPAAADCVYDAAKTGVRAWVWDVAEDSVGRPVIVYTRLPAETDHRYHYARWDGKQWQDTEMAAGGKWFPKTPAGKTEPEPHYSGGIALDHSDVSTVYLSRPVNGVFEIEKWTTADAGKTWKSESITSGSKADNVRPFVVRGHVPGGPTVLWMSTAGGYVHYTDYRATLKADRPPKSQMQPTATVAAGAPLSTNLTPAAILAAMERVADWQLADPSRHPAADWTVGALDAGMMALVGVSANPKYGDAMVKMGEANQWRLGPRRYHADDHCVGQTYAELWLRYREDKMIGPLRERFDDILANPKDGDLVFTNRDATDQWSWCDALFMGPPAWMRLYTATGDRRYLDFAVTNWWKTSDYLYDKEEHLYFRDSTYFTKREANGKKVFWSRGNGWVMAGNVRVLQFLPDNHPAHERFVEQFREMADKVLTCQQEDGLWRASLLDPQSYPLKETSGSGFYTYALAWGVNQGLLDRAKFAPVVAKGWRALVGCVAPDGKLTHVQPIGADPKKFDENATEVYGVGAFLLAGSEVRRMAVPGK